MTSAARPRSCVACTACVALAVAALAGCAVGPNYKRPKVSQPTSYRFQTGPPTAESLADLPWWKVFHDDSLHALVEEALRGNFDLLAASARVDQSRALASAAGAALLPALNADASGSYGNSLSGLGATPKPYWTVSATGAASWEIDVFGRLRRSREVARAQYAASEEARRGVWVTVIAEVAQNYFALLALDLQRSIAERTVAARAKTLDFFRVRSEGGVGTDLDVARGEADLFGAQSTLATVKQQTALTEQTISLLLGRAPGPIARPAVATELAAPPEVPAGLPSELLERRPDVREAEADLVAANAQVGVATANLFPTFSLNATGGIVSNNLPIFSPGAGGGGATSTSGIYSVGGQMSWLAPLLQGDSLRYQLDASKKGWLAVRAAYMQAVMTAFKDVSDALVQLARLRERRVEDEKQVASLARAVDVSQTQFEGGTATYLDVINAQEQLFPAELALAQLQGDQLGAYVQLYRALGGGWWLDASNDVRARPHEDHHARPETSR